MITHLGTGGTSDKIDYDLIAAANELLNVSGGIINKERVKRQSDVTLSLVTSPRLKRTGRQQLHQPEKTSSSSCHSH